MADPWLVLQTLKKLKKPIRIPTASWLFSDLQGCLDIEVRDALSWLKGGGYVTIDNGGWITVAPKEKPKP